MMEVVKKRVRNVCLVSLPSSPLELLIPMHTLLPNVGILH